MAEVGRYWQGCEATGRGTDSSSCLRLLRRVEEGAATLENNLGFSAKCQTCEPALPLPGMTQENRKPMSTHESVHRCPSANRRGSRRRRSVTDGALPSHGKGQQHTRHKAEETRKHASAGQTAAHGSDSIRRTSRLGTSAGTESRAAVARVWGKGSIW